MQVCGQQFSTEHLGRIQLIIDEFSTISRRVLSRRVCEILNWRSSNGKFQEGGCRKALVKLHRTGLIRLPEIVTTYSFSKSLPDIDVPVPEILCDLSELGDIEIIPIGSHKSNEAKVWKSIMNRYHYLGSGNACGGQIRYLVKSTQFGYLGGLCFSSGLLALQKRDEYITWSESARRANIGLVVLNNRFLILPSVHVPNLASHVLSLTLRRLPKDWELRYHCSPVLAETFVDPTRFDGACYKAANWISVGSSAGRRDGVKKDIYLYSLVPQWKERLCQTPIVRLGERAPVQSAGNWALQEFGTCRLYDQRLKDRLFTIADSFFNRPLADIPEASGSYKACKGSYRFFNNKKVTMDVILTPHVESTIERIKQHSIVLAPQDTTTLNYTHPDTVGLGPTGTKDDKSVGMLLHDTLAFTPDGTPLGVVDAQCWTRDPDDRGKSERRKETPIEEKESLKWLRSFRKVAEIQKLCPDTMLVSMGDRESDIFELLLEATKDSAGPKLLIRADKYRLRKVHGVAIEENEKYDYLWEHMEQQPLAGTLKIHIPKREKTPARDVIVAVKYSQVKINPPKDTKHQPLENYWAVHLCETDAVSGENQIDWMLLTTVKVASFEDAKRMSEWYAGRWGIEVYHRTLKSGCRILDRQLGSAEGLQACLGVDMVVAWRIYHLTMLGREVPDHPCTVFFEDVEWKALYCYANKTREAPENPPTLIEAILMVGKIGGHLGRKCDGMPGTECIWRGLQRLDTAVDMYVIFTDDKLPECRKSFPEAMHLRSGP